MTKTTAKKTIKTTIITLIALVVMAMLAVPVSAANEENVVSVDIPQTKVEVKTGKKVALGVSYSYRGEAPTTKATWKSSNSKVASVKNGVVTAKKAGTVKITAKMGNETDTCTVKVKPLNIKIADCYTQLNKYRKAKNLKGLKRDAGLEKIAKKRAEEMAKSGKFSHTRPNGTKGISLIKGNKWKGENIAKGQTSCKQVTTDWYKSTGHRENMMRKQFTKVGIAYYTYNGVTYWAQMFSN